MQFFFSFEQSGWYSPHYNTDIPKDAVEVDEQLRATLLAGVQEGKVIRKGADGMPELAAAPGLTDAQRAAGERGWRDAQLVATDAFVTRHRDEQDMGIELTLTAADYAALLVYRNELRAWPEKGEFPTTQRRPQAPAWLSDDNA